jgi:branched-chain amino acid transport system permease protein
MSAPSDNMPISVTAPRGKPLLLRHLPYFIGAAVVVVLAGTMQFDGYVHNILMEATTFAIAVFGLSVVLGLCGQINLAQAAFSVWAPMPSASAPRIITSATGSALPAAAS